MNMENTNNIPPEQDEVELEQCSWCFDEVEPDELSSDGYVSICESCQNHAMTCSRCDVWTHDEETTYIHDRDYYVCNDCARYYNYCDSCSEYNENDCEYCETRSDRVHDYSYRPSTEFFTLNQSGNVRTIGNSPVGRAFTGFELEVEVKGNRYEDAVETAYNIFGEEFVYLKHDGSLDNGFEIVSHPFDVNYLRTQINFARLKELTDLGVRSSGTTTCGLHVHINRSYFEESPSSLYRFMSMFYNNQDKWITIAGRNSQQWAEWSDDEKQRMIEYTRYMAKSDKANYRENYRRYCALNLQPSKTIELRFFKGTLKASTLAGRLEGVHAVAKYAKATRMNRNIKNMSDWDTFRKWTKEEGYELFDAYATERGV